MELDLKEWRCRQCGNAMLSEQPPDDQLCGECRDYFELSSEIFDLIASGAMSPEAGNDD